MNPSSLGENGYQPQGFQKNVRLTIPQSCSIAVFFLGEIYESRTNRISYEEREELGSVLGEMLDDPVYVGDWKDACTKAFGKSLQPDSLLTEQEAFQMTKEYCAFYYTMFDSKIKLPAVIQLLNSMVEHPDEYKKEWSLWKQSLATVINGEVLTAYDWDDEMQKLDWS